MVATGTVVLVAGGGAAKGEVVIGKVDVVDGVVEGGADMADALDVAAAETQRSEWT